jgi:hypothetical protein
MKSMSGHFDSRHFSLLALAAQFQSTAGNCAFLVWLSNFASPFDFSEEISLAAWHFHETSIRDPPSFRLRAVCEILSLHKDVRPSCFSALSNSGICHDRRFIGLESRCRRLIVPLWSNRIGERLRAIERFSHERNHFAPHFDARRNRPRSRPCLCRGGRQLLRPQLGFRFKERGE